MAEMAVAQKKQASAEINASAGPQKSLMDAQKELAIAQTAKACAETLSLGLDAVRLPKLCDKYIKKEALPDSGTNKK